MKYKFKEQKIKTDLLEMIRNRFLWIMNNYGIKQKQLSVGLGLSNAYVTYILKRNYKDISDNIVRCLAVSFRLSVQGFDPQQEFEKAIEDNQMDRLIMPDKKVVDTIFDMNTFHDVKIKYQIFIDSLKKQRKVLQLEDTNPHELPLAVKESYVQPKLFDDGKVLGKPLMQILSDNDVPATNAQDKFWNKDNQFDYAKSLQVNGTSVAPPPKSAFVKELERERKELVKKIEAIDLLLLRSQG